MRLRSLDGSSFLQLDSLKKRKKNKTKNFNHKFSKYSFITISFTFSETPDVPELYFISRSLRHSLLAYFHTTDHLSPSRPECGSLVSTHVWKSLFTSAHQFTHSHRSRGRLSEGLFLSSSNCFCSRSCSFFSLSSTSLSLAAVSTGLAAPNIEEVLLELAVLLWGDKLPLCSSSFGMLRGFRFNLGLCGGPITKNLIRLEQRS